MKKIISLLCVLMMLVSLFAMSAVTGFAEGEHDNIFKTAMYLDPEGSPVTSVFVGEEVFVKISLEDFENIMGYELALKYNKDVMQLYDGSAYIESDECKFSSITSAVTVKNSFVLKKTVKDTLYANTGYILYSAANKTPVSVGTDGTDDFITMKFKIKAAGEDILVARAGAGDASVLSGYGYAIEDVNPNGVIFVDETGIGSVTVNFDRASVTSYLKPGDPQSVAWPTGKGNERNYNAQWSAPETGCRGYILNLYKDGDFDVPVAANIETDSATYDFTDSIALNGPGTYVFGVKAKGGDNNSDEVRSEGKVVTKIQLTSTSASYDGVNDILSWSAVEHSNGYIVTVRNKKTGAAVSSETVYATSKSNLIGSLVGKFEITVTAVPESVNYQESPETPIEHSTGSTVLGRIYFSELTADDNKLIREYHIPTVTLTDITDSTKTYSAKGYMTETGGAFEVKKVPNGNYYVTLSGPSIVERQLKNSEGKNLYVSLTEDCVKDISKSDDVGLGVYIGNFNGDAGVNIQDVLLFLPTMDVPGKYNEKYDLYAGDVDGDEDGKLDGDGVIDADDLDFLIKTIGNGQSFYKSFNDYQNLTAKE